MMAIFKRPETLTCFFETDYQISWILAHSTRLDEYKYTSSLKKNAKSERKISTSGFITGKVLKLEVPQKLSTPHSTRNGRLSIENIRNYTLEIYVNGLTISKITSL